MSIARFQEGENTKESHREDGGSEKLSDGSWEYSRDRGVSYVDWLKEERARCRERGERVVRGIVEHARDFSYEREVEIAFVPGLELVTSQELRYRSLNKDKDYDQTINREVTSVKRSGRVSLSSFGCSSDHEEKLEAELGPAFWKESGLIRRVPRVIDEVEEFSPLCEDVVADGTMSFNSEIDLTDTSDNWKFSHELRFLDGIIGENLSDYTHIVTEIGCESIVTLKDNVVKIDTEVGTYCEYQSSDLGNCNDSVFRCSIYRKDRNLICTIIDVLRYGGKSYEIYRFIDRRYKISRVFSLRENSEIVVDLENNDVEKMLFVLGPCVMNQQIDEDKLNFYFSDSARFNEGNVVSFFCFSSYKKIILDIREKEVFTFKMYGDDFSCYPIGFEADVRNCCCLCFFRRNQFLILTNVRKIIYDDSALYVKEDAVQCGFLVLALLFNRGSVFQRPHQVIRNVTSDG
jgi:hypothetical protein